MQIMIEKQINFFFTYYFMLNYWKINTFILRCPFDRSRKIIQNNKKNHLNQTSEHKFINILYYNIGKVAIEAR